MIYDCFTFFNELDLLEIRLGILYEHVDHFVLVEADRTHTGIPKPLYFEENRGRFAPFLDKIIHIKVQDLPSPEQSSESRFGERWLPENRQRDAILRGLTECRDDDVIIISDADEIPSPQAIKRYRRGICSLEQKFMYYFLNCRSLKEPYWNKARICHYSDLLHPRQKLRKHDSYAHSAPGQPTYLRFCKAHRIPHGGWHFSYCGGVEAILAKRRAIVEQRFNTEENMRPETVLEAIRKGKDILGRPGYVFEAEAPDSSCPQFVLDHQQRYAHLLCPPSHPRSALRKLLIRLGVFHT